jgi:type II secretory pathway pseudopilin PulG
MKASSRPGYGLFQLLVVVALVAMLAGMLLPAVYKVRISAARMQSANNLKQIGLAFHNYAAVNDNKLPPGIDDKHFSALFQLLPFIEQDNLYKTIDKTADSDDKVNAKFRTTTVKTFLSPLDSLNEKASPGGTNYFAMTGSKMPIGDNDGLFCRNNKFNIGNIPDGTSNTVLFVEMLRGDGGKKAVSVQRQHVRLKAGDLKTLKVADGVKDFENDKNIAADRGSAWIDGRFLLATTNATRGMLDPKPDVDCGGEGGLAGIRAVADGTTVGVADGSVRWISSKLTFATWQNACNASDGNVLGDDW